MAANATAVWRVRPSGNNNNGGGFDCSISAAATGTHGSFTGTTFTDATAAAFTAGMVGSSINITGIGQYKITARIDASNITLGSGNPALTLASPLSWTVGSGQDYSQQNAAQLSQSSTANTSTATTTLTDTGAAFTTAVIGNAIRVSGTGITTTYTFIIARPSATTLTLQTSPGTTGTAVSYNIGGGWATFANCATTGPAVANNIIYFLGSGTPNPAAYTYDFDATASFNPAVAVSFSNDPATPGYKAPPDTTGGMPVIKFDVASTLLNLSGSSLISNGLWFVGTATSAGNYLATMAATGYVICFNGCVLDQFGQDIGLLTINAVATVGVVIGCEGFSSVSAGAGTKFVVNQIGGGANNNVFISGCNFHDCIANGINGATVATAGMTVINSIIAKCNGDGITVNTYLFSIQNCTIDGNTGNGIKLNNATQGSAPILNNIISNHTGVGKFGIVSSATGTPVFLDFNVYYNNTADLSNLQYGPHDTHGGSNPYVGQTTQNFTLV